MNRHRMIDATYNRVSRVVVRTPFPGGIESESIATHLAAIDLTLPDTLGRAPTPVDVRHLRGDAKVQLAVLRWVDDAAPTVIHHHGTGQRDFVKAARALWDQETSRKDVNLIALGGAFHEDRQTLMTRIKSVEGWVLLHTIGTVLLDRVLGHPQLAASSCRVATGFSLGGTIAYHHHLFYGSADAYLPIASGYRVGDVMLNSTHRGRATPEVSMAVRAHLNLPGSLDRSSGPPILPVLGRHDTLNDSVVQAAELGDEIEWWDCGHISGAGTSMAPAATQSLDRILSLVGSW